MTDLLRTECSSALEIIVSIHMHVKWAFIHTDIAVSPILKEEMPLKKMRHISELVWPVKCCLQREISV